MRKKRKDTDHKYWNESGGIITDTIYIEKIKKKYQRQFFAHKFDSSDDMN